MANLASHIEHTLLAPDATSAQIKALCDEAADYNFAAVCVNPIYVRLCSEMLDEFEIPICAVINYPLGASTPSVKAFEAENTINDGAKEIEVVMNIGPFKDGRHDYVLGGIRLIKELCGSRILKVTIESSLLNQQEKIDACKIIREGGADYIVTSTGCGAFVTTLDDIKLIKSTIGAPLKIKAFGGITNSSIAEAMIAAGADRLGTTNSLALIKG
jgi:deoxyribose-phosphate aldolase